MRVYKYIYIYIYVCVYTYTYVLTLYRGGLAKECVGSSMRDPASFLRIQDELFGCAVVLSSYSAIVKSGLKHHICCVFWTS